MTNESNNEDKARRIAKAMGILGPDKGRYFYEPPKEESEPKKKGRYDREQ
jgi:hypothetical protein